KEYQIGTMTPRSVAGGLFESGFSLAIASLIGPGLLAERFDSPVNTSALVCPNAGLPIAPALMAAAAAPSTVRRFTSCLVRCFIGELLLRTLRKPIRQELRSSQRARSTAS